MFEVVVVQLRMDNSISAPFVVFTVWLLEFDFHFLASLRCRLCLSGSAGFCIFNLGLPDLLSLGRVTAG